MAEEEKKLQRIWIVRYGLTATSLVEDVGPFDSDLDSGEGLVHADAIATRIAEYGSDQGPDFVYSSPFLRTCRTAHIIADKCNHVATNTGVSVRIEEGLTEWQVPSLLVHQESGVKTAPRTVKALSELYGTIDASFSSLNPAAVDDDDTTGAPRFPETEETLIQRCASTMEKLLEHHGSDGASFAIVSHAPCDQALALYLEGTEVDRSNSQIVEWPLGGITMFERSTTSSSAPADQGPWKLAYYGDTTHMPGDYKTGLKHWSLPCLQK